MLRRIGDLTEYNDSVIILSINEIGGEMDNNTNRSENVSLIITIVVIVLLISGAIAWFFTYKDAQNKKIEPKVVKENVRSLVDNKLQEKTVVKEKTEFELDGEKFYSLFNNTFIKDFLDNYKGAYDLVFFRRLVKYGLTGDYLANNKGVSWETLDKIKIEALELARKLMSNPEFIKTYYEKIKPLIHNYIFKSKPKKTKKLLKNALNFFNGSLNGQSLDLFQKHLNVDNKLYTEIQKRKYNKALISKLTKESDNLLNKLKSRGYGNGDIYIFQFAMRRKSEGGDELLKAYSYIIEDLITSIQ